MRKEAAIKKKIGNLIDSMLCDDSQISEMDNTKNKTEAFDIDAWGTNCRISFYAERFCF